MPGGNRMGPLGEGPMTGRGMGWCRGGSDPASGPTRGSGFGMGRGGGRGRGWRHWYNATGLTGWQRAQMGWPGPGAGSTRAFSQALDLTALKQQAHSLKQALSQLVSRIRELDKPAQKAEDPAEK